MTYPTNTGQQVAGCMSSIFGNCTNNVANLGPPLTLEAITQSIERVYAMLEAPEPSPVDTFGPMHGFGGIRIIESAAAVRRERVKTYPKRKSKSDSHWMRMDKKWRKRYGWREVPQMYMFQANRDLHMPAAVLIHPSQAVLLRNFK